jgi:membrane protease YdiL (CAAX protease family)
MNATAFLLLLLGIFVYIGFRRLLFVLTLRLSPPQHPPQKTFALWLAQLGGGLLLALVLVALALMLPLLLGHYAIAPGGGPDEITAAARLMKFSTPLPLSVFLGYITYFALGEELLFRGILMLLLALLLGGLAKALVGARIVRTQIFLLLLWLNAIVISAVAFCLLHADNPSVDTVALTNIFLIGIVFGFTVLFTRGITFAAALHMGWNALLELINLPVSGFNFPTAWHPFNVVAVEDGLLTGGAFGPEASIGLTVVLLIIIAACLYTLPRVLRAQIAAMPPSPLTESPADTPTESESGD